MIERLKKVHKRLAVVRESAKLPQYLDTEFGQALYDLKTVIARLEDKDALSEKMKRDIVIGLHKG